MKSATLFAITLCYLTVASTNSQALCEERNAQPSSATKAGEKPSTSHDPSQTVHRVVSDGDDGFRVVVEPYVRSRQPTQVKLFTTSGVDFRVKCETDGTTSGGVRDSCHDGPIRVTAPEGFVFDESSLIVNNEAERGGDYSVRFDDYVVIVPGYPFEAPKTIVAYVHARSPKVPPLGNIGVSGVMQIRVRCNFTPLP